MRYEPYFLKNKDWYEVNVIDIKSELSGEEKRYSLTDKAPQKAIDSYNAFYAESLTSRATNVDDLVIIDD